MIENQSEIIANFGHQLRVRVSGICFFEDKILLVKHLHLGKGEYLWAPPGGGLHFGESAEDCLKREFWEETGLIIKVEKFLFIHEFLAPPLHAVELFFAVKIVSGELKTGFDPEMSQKSQIIQDVDFLDWENICQENPLHLHAIFGKVQQLSDILQLKGYFLHCP